MGTRRRRLPTETAAWYSIPRSQTRPIDRAVADVELGPRSRWALRRTRPAGDVGRVTDAWASSPSVKQIALAPGCSSFCAPYTGVNRARFRRSTSSTALSSDRMPMPCTSTLSRPVSCVECGWQWRTSMQTLDRLFTTPGHKGFRSPRRARPGFASTPTSRRCHTRSTRRTRLLDRPGERNMRSRLLRLVSMPTGSDQAAVGSFSAGLSSANADGTASWIPTSSITPASLRTSWIGELGPITSASCWPRVLRLFLRR